MLVPHAHIQISLYSVPCFFVCFHLLYSKLSAGVNVYECLTGVSIRYRSCLQIRQKNE